MGLLRVVQDLDEAKWDGTAQAAKALHDSKSSIPIPELIDHQPPATPPARTIITKFGTAKKLSILFVYPPTKPANEVWAFARCLRNIPGVEIMSTDEVEVYHILKYKWLVLEGGAVDYLSSMKGMGSNYEDEGELGLDMENEEWEDVEENGTPSAVGLDSEATAEASEEEMSSVPTLYEPAENRVGTIEGGEVEEAGAVLKLPKNWIIHRWRKIRGAKSMRKAFGTKNATAMEISAKRTRKRLIREKRAEKPKRNKDGKRLRGGNDDITPDEVLLQMHKRRSEAYSVRTQ
jgi:hypothetical protein